MAPPPPPHIVIFPFMAHGHTLPLLDLSKALSNHQIKVTFITTPSNSKSISRYLTNYPNIVITELPFPTINGLPKNCENTSDLPSMDFFFPFLVATKQLQKPFEQLLETMVESEDLPICVVSDFFLGWTLKSCQTFGVPRLVFHGMGVLSMVISKLVWGNTLLLNSTSNNADPLEFPGIELPFRLTFNELPETLKSSGDVNPFTQIMLEVGESDINSYGVIVNSFEELEKNYVSVLETFYRNEAKVWCLGPLFLFEKTNVIERSIVQNQTFDLRNWMDEQLTPASILYVAFGTQADISDAQLDEVAFGLEASGMPFVWAVRFSTWKIPDGMEERLKGKGWIVREWVNQRNILSHRAIGGFLSHCGWNSVLESISAGVPILAWPMIAEQSLNAKLVVDGLGAGINLKIENWVSGLEICNGVRKLMGEEGRKARERSQALARVARIAVEEGGSSHDTLGKLIDELCVVRGY